MKYTSLVISLIAPVFLMSCDQRKADVEIPVVVDITAIARKTPAEVARVFGPPSSSSETKNGTKQSFNDDQIEIVFIDGFADWITIEAMDDVRFSDEAIRSLGLSAASPTFSNANVRRWEGIAGLREISIFSLQGKVDYAYVKANTK